MPEKLIKLKNLAIFIPKSNYKTHRKIIDEYAIKVKKYKLPAEFDENQKFVKVKIISKSLCELMHKLGTDLDIYALGKFEEWYSGIYCPIQLMCDVIKYKIPDKLNLLQTIISVYDTPIDDTKNKDKQRQTKTN